MVITDRPGKATMAGKEESLFETGVEGETRHESAQSEFVIRNLPSVFRSNGKVEKFDPERIMASLLSETSITEEKAKEVTGEFVIKMLNSEHPEVTAPFIREQICSILFQKNPTWRFEYTRLGMPFRDFEAICKGYFDQYRSSSEIDGSIDRIVAAMDKETLEEIVRRMAKDYVGVRNNIRDGVSKP